MPIACLVLLTLQLTEFSPQPGMCVCVCVCLVTQSYLTLRLHGLCLARLPCPWDSPGKNTGVGSHSLLQGNPPDPGIEPGSPSMQADSLPSKPP